MAQLVTVQELKEFLSIQPTNTNDDARLSNIVLQVSTLVSSYCGREFASADYLEFFDGGQSSIFVSNPPINSVNELSHFNGSYYAILGGPDNNGQPLLSDGVAHIVSNVGIPILKIRTKKFGNASLLVTPGNYVTVPTSDDWELGSDNFTMELYVRFNDLSIEHSLLQSGDIVEGWNLYFDPVSEGISFIVSSATLPVLSMHEGSISGYQPNIFYHFVVERVGNTWTIYKDGVAVATETSYVNIPNYGTGIAIGNYMNGYIDSLRISHDATYKGEFSPNSYQLPATSNTKLLLNMDGANNTSKIEDTSRNTNGFSFYKDTGEITFNTSAPELMLSKFSITSDYHNGVRVSYNGGFKTIPADLKMAVMEMAKVVFKGKSGTDVIWHGKDKSESMPLAIDGFPPQVRRILNLYRLVV